MRACALPTNTTGVRHFDMLLIYTKLSRRGAAYAQSPKQIVAITLQAPTLDFAQHSTQLQTASTKRTHLVNLTRLDVTWAG